MEEPKQSYSQKLKSPKWQKKRLEVLSRDEFKCTLCGNDQLTLHVHHHSYEKTRNPWDSPLEELTTYCHVCHEMVEHLNSIFKYKCFGVFIKEYSEMPHVSCYYLVGDDVDRDLRSLIMFTYNFKSNQLRWLHSMSFQTLSEINSFVKLFDVVSNGI